MKKKIIAAILSLTMVLNTFSIAGAAEFEFTDGEARESVVDEQIPEEAELFDDENVSVENEEVQSANENVQSEPIVETFPIGDNANAIVTYVHVPDIMGDGAYIKPLSFVITGTGDTWDYLEDGCDDNDGTHKNPFLEFNDRGYVSSITIENGITSIGDRLFSSWTIGEISIADSVKSIGKYTFKGTGFKTDIILPENMTELGKYVFENARFANEAKLIHNGVIEIIPEGAFSGSDLSSFDFRSVKEIGYLAFEGTNLSTVEFSDSLKKIGNRAFAACGQIKSIKFPDTVEQIIGEAFYRCTALTDVILPNSGLVLSGTFRDCIGLQSIVIPEKVKELMETFWGCSRLLNVTIKGNKTEIGEFDLFGDCPRLQSVSSYDCSYAKKYVDTKGGIEFKSLGAGTHEWEEKKTIDKQPTCIEPGSKSNHCAICGEKRNREEILPLGHEWGNAVIIKEPTESEEGLKRYTCWRCGETKDEKMPPVGQSGSIQVGDKVYATIDGDTLTLSGSGSIWDSDAAGHWSEVMSDSEKRGITKIEFVGNEITSIGNEVFWNFTGVKYVELPESILELGHDVFAYCESLEKIILPDALKVIPSGAFYNCVNLKEFTVPETVIEINSGAFGGCTELTNVTIPKSVTYFGNDVFRDCRNLTIHGFRDSAAERYANNNYIPFVSVDFKVIFKVDGRTVGDPQYIKAGGDAKPPELTKEGYTLSWDADYTDIQEDMIINAVWTKNGSEVPQPTPTPQPPIIIYPPEDTKYTVTFKDRGKTIKTEKVKSGEAADLPYIARYGYELSWDKDFSKVTSNMTVNAIWTIMKPEKVTSLTAEIISKKISLSWDESEYAGYYKIYRKASTDKEFILAAKTSQTLWNDRKAKSGVKYQYKAVAVRSVSGELYTSPESDIATVKLGAPEKGQIYTVGKLNYKVMNNTQVRVTGAAKVSGSVVIPKTVTICDKVFKVTSIDHKAFYQNANLINVEIGDYVTYVGQYSFYRCPNLETVKIGKNVEVISTCAFTECPKLGNVTLPGKMRRLGAKVFYHCPKLKVLYIKTNYLEYIGKKGLAIDKKTTIKVPSRKYSAYKKMIEDSVKFAATKIVKL